MKKILSILLGMVLCIVSFAASARTLTDEINQLIKHNLPNADIGIVVSDAKTGEIIYQHNAFQKFSPASNTKLFSSAAALLYLKPDYRFVTTVKINPKKLKDHVLKGNVYFTFSGDPSFSSKELQQLVKQVRSYGIKKIKGKIIIDNTRYRAPDYPAGVSYEDVNWYYSAPINAIIINQNAVPVSISPSKILGRSAKVRVQRFPSYFKTSSKVRTVTTKYAEHHCDLFVDVNNMNHAHFYGCTPISHRTLTQKIAVRNPLLFASQLIQSGLRNNDILLQGSITAGKTPKGLTTIAENKSPSLATLVKYLLKVSDNVYADSILKTVGAEYSRSGSFIDGSNAVKAILGKYTNIDFNQMELTDGSGSRFNLMSPRQISHLLYSIYNTPQIRDVFINSLPDAGVNGSLKRRMRAFDTINHVEAKTGTMHDTSALSGYITTPKKRKLIFSIIINHVVGNIKEAKQLENKICSAVIRHHS